MVISLTNQKGGVGKTTSALNLGAALSANRKRVLLVDNDELREKGKVLVRVIFTIQDSGEVMLLHAFIKRQKRDTMQALEQSIRILADLREHPEYAVEFKIKEETG